MSWPEVVWDSPMVRGIDARARAEIEAAGTLRQVRAGGVLYRPGDPADALYVITSGACTLWGIRRGEEEPTLLRKAQKGDVVGEEGTIAAFTTRQLEARCDVETTFAEIPLVVLKRSVGRAGGAELMAKVERALRRAATHDLLRRASFTRTLSEADLDVLLDAAKPIEVARGEYVYREGEPSNDAFLVASGMLQVQTEEDGKPRVEAYLASGDLFGDEELTRRDLRTVSVVAGGPSTVIAIPRDVWVVFARRDGKKLEGERRLRTEGTFVPKAGMTNATVFQDVYRLRVARSLLVIDQDSCIRCGHCAWSCADVHEDGVSRLVRRGDKLVVSDGVEVAKAAPLLVPNSCQHCKNPSCMIDCPTGAIGRDARGEVFIREDLCTGCGSCAKACPWENIQMAPHPKGAIAVKCDLCSGKDHGPACVAACPTQAIVRIDPSEALSAGKPVLPARVLGWPWAVGALFAGFSIAFMPLSRMTTGIVSGGLIALLAGYPALKRSRLALSKKPRARWMYVAHVATGMLAIGVMGAHAGPSAPPNSAGALTLAIGVAIAFGLLGAICSVLVPPALSRLERKSVLPEELADIPRVLDEKIFATLSGKSEVVKTLFAKVLRPYVKSRALGPLLLIASRRSLRKEEKAIRARIDALVGSRKDRLGGIDDLIRLVVEHRAVRTQRALTWALRGWIYPHVAATTAAVVLLALHILAVLR